MTKFNFKLERVLNYKKTVEDYKKNKFGLVQQKLNREEAILNDFNVCKESVLNEKSNSNLMKVGHLALYNTYINDLNLKIQMQEQKVKEAEVELEKAKEEMIHAVKEKKIFEKLKENEFEKFTYELKKEEEKLNDTIVSFKATTQQ
ncbi:MAG: flagellar export protein FliJ [Tissierellia bacterium]|nr:flagellar export protein FliJ [Tissierellia bacterium]